MIHLCVAGRDERSAAHGAGQLAHAGQQEVAPVRGSPGRPARPVLDTEQEVQDAGVVGLLLSAGLTIRLHRQRLYGHRDVRPAQRTTRHGLYVASTECCSDEVVMKLSVTEIKYSGLLYVLPNQRPFFWPLRYVIY